MTTKALSKNLAYIKEDCQHIVKNYAIAGAVNGINPIPGVDITIDIGICLKLMNDIRSRFGLNERAREQLMHYEALLPLVQSVFDIATKQGVTALLKSIGKRYLGKSAMKYVPIIGQAIAAGAGYALMMYFGEKYISDCYELAQKMDEYDIEVPVEYVDDEEYDFE